MPKIGSVHWKRFEAFLIEQGCYFEREKGDHRVYWKKGLNRPVIIPRDKQLPAFVIYNNLRTLGIDRKVLENFLERNKKRKK